MCIKTETTIKPKNEYLSKVCDAIYPMVDHVLYDVLDPSNPFITEMYHFIKAVEKSVYNNDSITNVLILYHTDLDGNMSAFATMLYIRAAVEFFCESKDKHKLKFFRENIKVETLPLNYHYDINKYEEQINKANIIFLVDYSVVSNYDHIDRLIKFANDDQNNMICWIDHHESSIMGATDTSSKYYDKCQEFINTENVCHVLYTEVGFSAAMLCYTLYGVIMFNLYNTRTTNAIKIQKLYKKTKYLKHGCNNHLAYAILYSCPEIILRTSLYDTFHELSDRAFSTGINTVETSPYGLYKKAIENSCNPTVAYNESFAALCSLLDAYDYNRDTNSADIVELPFAPLDGGKSVFYANSMMNSIIESGKIIVGHEIMMHNRLRNSAEFDISLIVHKKDNSTEIYNVAVMNTNGNSFCFEESYNTHDAVILWYQAKDLNYIYSIFSNLNNIDHVYCRTIAEYFNGGGHEGAAGWQSRFNLFDESSKFLWGYGIEFVPKDPEGSTWVLRIDESETVDLTKLSPRGSEDLVAAFHK